MKWPATCRPWMAADRPVIQSAWNSSSFSSLIGGELNEEAFLTRESTCGASRWRQIYWQLFKKLRCNNFRRLKHQSISINFITAALLIFLKNWPNIFLNQQRPNRTRWLIRDLVPTSLFGNKKEKPVRSTEIGPSGRRSARWQDSETQKSRSHGEGDTSQSPAVDAEHVGVCAQKKKFPPFSFKIEKKKRFIRWCNR